MTDAADTDADDPWDAFVRNARLRPRRELLWRTLNAFRVEQRPAGIAVDLGCGSGPDTIELLRQGWTVHAVDPGATGLQLLRDGVPAEARDRLHTHAVAMEDVVLPACDLVWSSWALPYCPAGRWLPLLDAIAAALRPGGRFAGDVFGPRHAWAGEDGVLTIDEAVLRAQLAARFAVEAFDIEDGLRPSGAEMTRWHAFGISVRRPDPSAEARVTPPPR